MTLGDWVMTAAVLTVCLLLSLTAVDRNRMKQRLGNAEGVITGLTLDLDATHARVEQLQSYLNVPSSWDVDAATPPVLADPRPADRWSVEPVARKVGSGASERTSSSPLQSQG